MEYVTLKVAQCRRVGVDGYVIGVRHNGVVLRRKGDMGSERWNQGNLLGLGFRLCMVCGNATVELRTRAREIVAYVTLKVAQCSQVNIDGYVIGG